MDIEEQLPALYHQPELDQPISPAALLAAVHQRRDSEARRAGWTAAASALVIGAVLLGGVVALTGNSAPSGPAPHQPAASTTPASPAPTAPCRLPSRIVAGSVPCIADTSGPTGAGPVPARVSP